MKRIFIFLAALLAAQSLLAGVVLETKGFKLSFASDGRPASFMLADGEELLNVADPGRGFYLQNASPTVIALPAVSLRGNKELLVESDNRTQKIVFELTQGEQYVAMRIKELKGVPASSALTLHFEMNTTGNVKAMALDFMTPHLDHIRGEVKVNLPFLYHRYKDDPLGGFALYCPKSDDDEDDTILHMWGDLGLPHPEVASEWNYNTAKTWVQKWQAEFADQSRMMFEAESLNDLYEGAKYAEEAGLKGIYLMPWVWRGSYWPTDMPNNGINKKVFPEGRADVKKYSEFLQSKGMRLLFHYVSGGIGYNDPVYIGTKPDRRLASWGGGTVAEKIGPEDRIIKFRPNAGVELPYRIPRENVHSFNALPPAMHFFHDFKMMRIEDEIIKVGSFEETDKGVWVLTNCERGKFTTQAAAHESGADTAGLIDAYDNNFIPDNNSTLLDEVAGNFADLLNECEIMNTEYDGGEIHCYQGPSQSIGWGYNKFTSKVYEKLDHPVMADSSAQRPPECHLEYKLNSTEALVGPIQGHQYYANLMPEHISRPATTLLDAHFQLSNVAATKSACYGLKTQDRGVSVDDLKTHGMAREICSAVGQWRIASGLMTDQQREKIIRRDVRWSENIWLGDKHTQSEIVQVLRKDGDFYNIYPVKVLTRKEGDVKWYVGQEHGSVAPKQFVKPGDELNLYNPFDKQEMRFVIRMLWATDYENQANEALTPKAANLKNEGDIELSDEGSGLSLRYKNSRAEAIWAEKELPQWDQKVDMSSKRSLGMWIEGDGSGALLLVQIPKRDYVVSINFKGRKYVEIPHGEASWADGKWGWRMGTWKYASYQGIQRMNIGFGEVPPSTDAKIRVEGIKALNEIETELINPLVSAGGGKLRIMGKISTGQYLEYRGGDKAVVYDKNWNKIQELPVQKHDYVLSNGWAKVSVTAENKALPWMEIQCMTEGDPIRVTIK